MAEQYSVQFHDEYTRSDFELKIPSDATLGELIDSIEIWEHVGPQNAEFQKWICGDKDRRTELGIYDGGMLVLDDNHIPIFDQEEYKKELVTWGLKDGSKFTIVRHGGCCLI